MSAPSIVCGTADRRIGCGITAEMVVAPEQTPTRGWDCPPGWRRTRVRHEGQPYDLQVDLCPECSTAEGLRL